MDANQHDAELEPQLPIDSGLASLGMLMQLGAAFGFGVAALFFLESVVDGGARADVGGLVVVALLGMLRSGAHFRGAQSLIYRRGEPRTAAKVYLYIAALHVVVAAYVVHGFDLDVGAVVAVVVLLSAWPVMLLVIVNRPRFRRYARAVPVPDDLAFEGVSIIMLILGLAAALSAAMMLVFIIRQPPNHALTSATGTVFLAIIGALAVRAILHVLTGHAGAVGGTPMVINAAASRYYNVGLATSAAVGGLMLLLAFRGQPTGPAMARLAFVVYLLLAWPLIVRTLFGERGITTIAASDDDHPERAPDQGLTSLGWLLLAMSVISMAVALPHAVWQSSRYTVQIVTFGIADGGDVAVMFGRSSWLAVVIAGLQMWAAIELITMSNRSRFAAITYGVVGGALTLYVMFPFISDWETYVAQLLRGSELWDPSLVGYAQLGLALVTPLATLALVLRRRTPHAQARFVTQQERQ